MLAVRTLPEADTRAALARKRSTCWLPGSPSTPPSCRAPRAKYFQPAPAFHHPRDRAVLPANQTRSRLHIFPPSKNHRFRTISCTFVPSRHNNTVSFFQLRDTVIQSGDRKTHFHCVPTPTTHDHRIHTQTPPRLPTTCHCSGNSPTRRPRTTPILRQIVERTHLSTFTYFGQFRPCLLDTSGGVC
jgi:hypothetical protein